jgi:dipeptidyl aminopeptidase/acylaminoacyl peptidase
MYSNELQVTKKTPPTFIFHAKDDKAVPIENSLQLLKALQKNKVPAEMHSFDVGGHGFGMRKKEFRLTNGPNF